ncbi:MAG: DNA-binding NtrC family response regulator [Yoonia sp.]|jgi:DNA-binding NtrC family response regulator
MTKFSILVVDDDKAMRLSLVELLEAADWSVRALSRAAHVAETLLEFMPDVILSDVRMPGMSGLELLAELDPQFSPPLVLISAHGDIAMAVEALQNGAYSFVEKPYAPRRLLTILRNAAERHHIARNNQRLKDRLFQLSGLDRVLLGKTPEMTALRQEILDIADIDAAVMIKGETGTGKELVARALHDLGSAPDGPFLALNCAALSPDSFEADMFGTHGGAQGRLLAASGGTLFLDEICSCPVAVQAKLLRVIEDKTVLPIGAASPVPVRLRIVSATNEDVDAALADRRLRADLLFRINTVELTMTPLRARRNDLTLLMTHFLAKYAHIYEVPPPAIAQDDLAALLAHDWPGNVRELRHVAERRVLAARRSAGSMADAIRRGQRLDDVPDTLREAVAAFERELITKAIKAHAGRMDAAADALGIGRRTLNEKIVKLGLDKDAIL